MDVILREVRPCRTDRRISLQGFLCGVLSVCSRRLWRSAGCTGEARRACPEPSRRGGLRPSMNPRPQWLRRAAPNSVLGSAAVPLSFPGLTVFGQAEESAFPIEAHDSQADSSRSLSRARRGRPRDSEGEEQPFSVPCQSLLGRRSPFPFFLFLFPAVPRCLCGGRFSLFPCSGTPTFAALLCFREKPFTRFCLCS